MNITPAELVDCKISVSPALARRIRKAELVEQSGEDAHGALMIAAGYEPDEIDTLKSQMEDMSSNLIASEQDQAMTKATADQLVVDLAQTREKLAELGKTNKRIAVLEEALTQSVETRGLPDKLVEDISNLIETIRGGEKSQTALLAAAGYNIDDVDEAMSSMEPLKANIADLELTVTPLRRVLASKGVKAWIARRILSV